MPHFIVNRNQQPDSGDHEVHNKTEGCRKMPNAENQIDLGYHTTCHGAVSKAKREYPQWKIDGCAFCCKECNNG